MFYLGLLFDSPLVQLVGCVQSNPAVAIAAVVSEVGRFLMDIVMAIRLSLAVDRILLAKCFLSQAECKNFKMINQMGRLPNVRHAQA